MEPEHVHKQRPSPWPEPKMSPDLRPWPSFKLGLNLSVPILKLLLFLIGTTFTLYLYHIHTTLTLFAWSLSDDDIRCFVTTYAPTDRPYRVIDFWTEYTSSTFSTFLVNVVLMRYDSSMIVVWMCCEYSINLALIWYECGIYVVEMWWRYGVNVVWLW